MTSKGKGRKRKAPSISLPGITSAKSEGKYHKLGGNDVESTSTGFWRPSTNSNINADEMIEFNLTVRLDQMIKFPAKAFCLLLEATHPNRLFLPKPNTGDYAADVTPLQKQETGYLDPTNLNPAIHFEGALGASSFFWKMDILVNDHPLRSDELGNWGYVFQVMNQIFTDWKTKLEHYGGVPRCSTAVDRVAPSTADAAGEWKKKMSKDLLDSMESLTFDSVTSSKSKLLRFSMDGKWPFFSQSNIMRNLTGVDIPHGYIPPGTKLTVRLYKRTPLDACIERPKIDDSAYYSDNAATALTGEDVVTFKFVDLMIVYDIITLKQSAMDRIRKQTARYFLDIPKIVVQRVAAKTIVTENTVHIPKGAKCLIVTWMKSQQLFHQKSKNKNLSARFHFPRTGIRTTFELANTTGSLFFQEGLQHHGTTSAHASPVCQAYYRELVRKKLYDRSFYHLFPREGNGNDQVAIIDLTHTDTSETRDLKITTHHTDDLSEDQWFMVICSIQQGSLTLREKEEPVLEILV